MRIALVSKPPRGGPNIVRVCAAVGEFRVTPLGLAFVVGHLSQGFTLG